MYNNKNHWLAILILAAFLFSLFTISVSSFDTPNVSAKSAALYEPITKTFVYTKNEHARLPMASTTKIMTALVALENSELTDTVTVDSRSVGIEGSSAYLKEGDRYTIEDMLYALLLQSANDAAVAIACEVGGDTESFVEMMNERVLSLGLENTHFDNPNGLDGDTHYTTAHDLALITAEAMKNDSFRRITSTYKKTVTNGDSSRLFVNHNKLLKMYDGCTGVKTGFTKKSGRCLVGSAERDGLSLITVTLDAPNDWQDHKKMLDYGFGIYENRVFAEAGEYSYDLPVINSKGKTVRVANTAALSAVMKRTEAEAQAHIKLPKYIIAPVNEGDILGSVIFTVDGEMIGKLDLVALDEVKTEGKKNIIIRIWDRLFNKDNS